MVDSNRVEIVGRRRYCGMVGISRLELVSKKRWNDR
jgi:hypothetical protein